MNKHMKLHENCNINEWGQVVNIGSWIILLTLTVVSFLVFLNVCGFLKGM